MSSSCMRAIQLTEMMDKGTYKLLLYKIILMILMSRNIIVYILMSALDSVSTFTIPNDSGCS